MEQWRDIEGYEGLYEISNLGNVKSLPKLKENYKGSYYTKERILKLKEHEDGYWEVRLYKDKKQKTYYVHRLVAAAFIENPNNYPEINHIDENKKNNLVENLEWCDHLYNMHHGRCQEKRINSSKKPVLQFDQQNNFIKKWDSITEAGATLKIQKGSISRCCKGELKTTGGFKWKYAPKKRKDII